VVSLEISTEDTCTERREQKQPRKVETSMNSGGPSGHYHIRMNSRSVLNFFASIIAAVRASKVLK
jgi:hypothetical protein